MKKLSRLVLTLAASFFTLLLLAVFVPLFTAMTEPMATWFSVPIAIIVGWYTWKKLHKEKFGTMAAIFTGAILIGGISFTAGFLGPMLLAPSANQGPLLGIFITGPLGLVVGAIGGFIYWFRKNKTADENRSL
jgi:hypothetical protein